MAAWLKSIWSFAEVLATFAFLVGTVWAAWWWFSGVFPVLFRLGNLRKREIAIFAKGEASTSLSALFADAKVFNSSNIISIARIEDFGRADNATIFIVHWPDWIEELDQILAKKRDQTPLVVYAPAAGARIPPGVMATLDQHRQVVVANFRGRLLNDVVSSFITTAYEKR